MLGPAMYFHGSTELVHARHVPARYLGHADIADLLGDPSLHHQNHSVGPPASLAR